MDPPPQPQTTAKIRLMCSYGGHIKPLPCKKSLFYSGGDTRIITVPISSTASVSAFSAHIAATLHVSYPFVVKYQLPLHDLDSLISLSSNDDLQIFLEEFQRLCSNPAPARIRLFLFAVKQPELMTTTTTQCGLTHPKTESWFVDALKSAKMMQKGEMEFGGEGGQCQAENNGNVGLCGQESVVLESTSSFGSSTSSVSLSNLPPIKACADDNMTLLQDNKTGLPSSESTTSDIYSMGSAISYAQTGSHQDPVAPFAAMGNKVSLNSSELSDTKIFDPVSEVPGQKVVQASGHQFHAQLDQVQGQQIPLVQMGTHYVPQNPTGVLPVASYYPICNTLLQQQQQLQFLPNQSNPVYVIPAGQTQLYESCAQYGSKETLPVVSCRPPLHPNTMFISPQVAYKDIGATSPIPEFVSHVYRTTPVGNSIVHIPYNENKQQPVVVPQIHNQPQVIGVASREAANYTEELDDDPARAQIYKSQPPPPALPSQYKTMTKATAMLLSEALGQLHMENIKQQVRTSQPQ